MASNDDTPTEQPQGEATKHQITLLDHALSCLEETMTGRTSKLQTAASNIRLVRTSLSATPAEAIARIPDLPPSNLASTPEVGGVKLVGPEPEEEIRPPFVADAIARVLASAAASDPRPPLAEIGDLPPAVRDLVRRMEALWSSSMDTEYEQHCSNAMKDAATLLRLAFNVRAVIAPPTALEQILPNGP